VQLLSFLLLSSAIELELINKLNKIHIGILVCFRCEAIK